VNAPIALRLHRLQDELGDPELAIAEELRPGFPAWLLAEEGESVVEQKPDKRLAHDPPPDRSQDCWEVE
jgi:hypothetical protein